MTASLVRRALHAAHAGVSLLLLATGLLLGSPDLRARLLGGYGREVAQWHDLGAYAFLGVPARELTDAHADLAALWGSIARELRERLCETKTVADRFRILEDALLARLRGSYHVAVSEALAAFERSRGAASIREVARATGLSQRRFIDVFRDAVGLTPKLYCRVLRFQHARALGGRDWGEIALEASYADQAHLIRDFREFTSMTPAEYARRVSDDCFDNHVAI